MTGGAISGYCATGSVGNDTTPAMTIRMAMTHATIGRRMKNRLNTRPVLRTRRRRGVRRELLEGGFDGDAGPGALEAVDHDAVRGVQPLDHDTHRPVERADLHPPDFDGVLVVDHQRIAPGLVRQERDVGRDRFLDGLPENPDPDE